MVHPGRWAGGQGKSWVELRRCCQDFAKLLIAFALGLALVFLIAR